MKFLRHPGWIGATLGVFVFATLCFTLLAPWQFRRHEEKKLTNATIEASAHSTPTPIDRLLRPDQQPGPDQEWHQVSMRGRYLDKGEVVLRLRVVQGQPAYEVLTPFELAGGGIAIVDRGYLTPGQNNSLPDYPAPPTGEVDLVARTHSDQVDRDNREPLRLDGRVQLYTADSQQVARVAGIQARPGVFSLSPDQPGLLKALPLPEVDLGPHLSYALQWLAFGAMAILAWGYYAWQEMSTGTPREKVNVARMLAQDEAAKH
ncbi:SURF1 family protein [Pseudonocardiaceae bacterium YIM PH 21723]|nr:SURF1 family protein [Pseudonocardiaceae bacterium YIM PH 21723]